MANIEGLQLYNWEVKLYLCRFRKQHDQDHSGSGVVVTQSKMKTLGKASAAKQQESTTDAKNVAAVDVVTHEPQVVVRGSVVHQWLLLPHYRYGLKLE